jgi:hypothetical protein
MLETFSCDRLLGHIHLNRLHLNRRWPPHRQAVGRPNLQFSFAVCRTRKDAAVVLSLGSVNTRVQLGAAVSRVISHVRSDGGIAPRGSL